jgi:hypothetical protein
LALMASALLGMLPLKTAAQCFGSLPGLGSINSMPGNPFQAEVKQKFLSDNPPVTRVMEPRHGAVARDSQGRLRTEWSAGKFKVQNGPGAGAEEEQRHITICDPVKGESISLDTLNKTATVSKRTARVALSKTAASPAWIPSFCAVQFRVPSHLPGIEAEDLGHRTVEGMEAVGVLQKRALQVAGNTGGNSNFKRRTSVTELWCSEELGAVILRIMGTEEKGDNQSFALVNIQRGEPDAGLFQIPPDYRVLERVNEMFTRGTMGAVGEGVLVPSTAEPPAPISKP